MDSVGFDKSTRPKNSVYYDYISMTAYKCYVC